MGEQNVPCEGQPERMRLFMKRLLSDLRALDVIVRDGMIESGVRRIGMEQEVFLVDGTMRPAPVSLLLLEELDRARFTTELALFNLEFNLDPLEFGGDCLRRLEANLNAALAEVRSVAARHGVRAVLAGILPTLMKSDLHDSNMTPLPRYFALNDALKRLRAGAFEFRVAGTDELILKHESVMLEACNTSAQVHFQVGAEEFARFYNIAQAVLAPTVAAAANSPLLFGRRLWQETRIAVFQQAVDTRTPGMHVQDRSARVSFGNRWVKESALEIFQEDVARFRTLLSLDTAEDPFDVMRDGGVPKLNALSLHNGTVYRWNRPCYGVTNGRPHLRIENRVLPSGPTTADEVANAAFWFGLVGGLAAEYEDITKVMEFDTAKSNFLAAARHGLDAQFGWLDGRRRPAQGLICEDLVPLARRGLVESGVDTEDVDHYLGIIERRAATGMTGAKWTLDSLRGMGERGTTGQRLRALTACMASREQDGATVEGWSLARLDEVGGWRENYLRVEQYMTTDLFTVHSDEVIDLVANLMDWRHIRHVPVEDDEHRLVGLVSYRSLLRLLARDLPHGDDTPVPVNSIMQRDPITVSPETTTLAAMRVMRERRVACLPVVKDGRLVGIVTERDFMALAAEVVEAQLRE